MSNKQENTNDDNVFFSAIFARGLSGGFAKYEDQEQEQEQEHDKNNNSNLQFPLSLLRIFKDKCCKIISYAIKSYEINHDLDYKSMHTSFSDQNSTMPWNIKEDLKHFKQITTQSSKSTLIMGRKTFMSLPKLPDRMLVVVSKSANTNKNINNSNPLVHWVDSFAKALQTANKLSEGQSNSIFVIGGVDILTEAFQHANLEKVYETLVCDNKCNKYSKYFRNDIPKKLNCTTESPLYSTDSGLKFLFLEHTIDTGERHYLDTLEDLVTISEQPQNLRIDRTNTGVYSFFCPDNLIINLQEGFPLFTTKHVSFKNVAEELLWMIRGETHAKYLQEKNIKIWDGNSSREFLDNKGLQHFETGQMGKIYGHQLRNYGGTFDPNSRSQIGNSGFDQINYVLDLLRTDPFSRRIVIDLWNPCDFKDQSIPPCHMSCQFFVQDNSFENKTNTLSCKLIQRSGDMLLGVPYNCCSYALLTHILAATVNLDVGTLFVSIGDCHLYSNHIEQAKLQLSRTPRKLPNLSILNIKSKLEDYVLEDFQIHNYNPHPAIKATMAV